MGTEKKENTTSSGAKRDKKAKLRGDCKIENSIYSEEITARIMEFEPLRSIAEDYPDFSTMAVQRFAERHGLMEKRHEDRERILKLVVQRGLAKGIPIDAKTGLKALELLMKKHKEIESGGTTVNNNIQVVTPQELNERLNKADRLLPLPD